MMLLLSMLPAIRHIFAAILMLLFMPMLLRCCCCLRFCRQRYAAAAAAYYTRYFDAFADMPLRVDAMPRVARMMLCC